MTRSSRCIDTATLYNVSSKAAKAERYAKQDPRDYSKHLATIVHAARIDHLSPSALRNVFR